MAIILLKELKKIFGQIRGEERMFGYRSTTANQLYLLFCFCGNIYFTDKIHRQVKLLWFCLASWYIFMTYYVGLMYALYSDEKTLMKSLYVLSIQILGNGMQFVLPTISFYCRETIENTIDQVDKIVSQDTPFYYDKDKDSGGARSNALLDPKRVIIGSMTIYVFFNLVRLTSGLLDVIIFYDEAKLNNYLYYIFFLPKNQSVADLTVFLIINVVFDLTFCFVMMQWGSFFSFLLLWSVTCHNQLMLICNQLTNGMDAMRGYVENTHKPSKTWNLVFRRNLIQTIKKYQKIIRLIDMARKFVRIFCSFILPVAFLRQVTLLHHGLAKHVPFCVQLTGIAGFAGLLWTVYLIFWIGETLQSSVSTVSFAVYSTPWYWSIKVRQDLHVFLSQTQKLKNFPVITMHPLRLNSFNVYLNAVTSSVNTLLRRVIIIPNGDIVSRP